MALSITKLRADLYKIIDQVIATGSPVEIERNGHIVKIMAEKPKSKLDNLIKHPGLINGDPDDLVHIDWSEYWTEEKNL
jgi:hypothetical protein